MLAGTKLAEGAAGAQAGGARWSTRAGPTCSGQAYFVTDGQPTNLQSLLDGVLEGLGACLRAGGCMIRLFLSLRFPEQCLCCGCDVSTARIYSVHSTSFIFVRA